AASGTGDRSAIAGSAARADRAGVSGATAEPRFRGRNAAHAARPAAGADRLPLGRAARALYRAWPGETRLSCSVSAAAISGRGSADTGSPSPLFSGLGPRLPAFPTI